MSTWAIVCICVAAVIYLATIAWAICTAPVLEEIETVDDYKLEGNYWDSIDDGNEGW